MTNKKSLEELKSLLALMVSGTAEALDKAISALEQLPEPERWRHAEWPRDAASPPKEAKFRDGEDGDWIDGFLAGKSEEYWISNLIEYWLQCQVRDE